MNSSEKRLDSQVLPSSVSLPHGRFAPFISSPGRFNVSLAENHGRIPYTELALYNLPSLIWQANFVVGKNSTP